MSAYRLLYVDWSVQEDCDVEWKFARTKLWLNYIDEGSTLFPPAGVLDRTRNGGRGQHSAGAVQHDPDAQVAVLCLALDQ